MPKLIKNLKQLEQLVDTKSQTYLVHQGDLVVNQFKGVRLINENLLETVL